VDGLGMVDMTMMMIMIMTIVDVVDHTVAAQEGLFFHIM